MKTQIQARSSKPETRNHSKAFTLVEMLLVVTIIGILAALVVPRIAGKSQEAKVTAAQADIKGGIKSALDQYEINVGSYPRNLQDLIQRPNNAPDWRGPYLDELPLDPWHDPYIYVFPGRHNQNGYDLSSAGPDQQPGNDDDIGNWIGK